MKRSSALLHYPSFDANDDRRHDVEKTHFIHKQLSSGCRIHSDRDDRSGQTAVTDGPRKPQSPSTNIKQAVAAFRTIDPTATFTYFNGHIDSFSAAGKPSIPGLCFADSERTWPEYESAAFAQTRFTVAGRIHCVPFATWIKIRM